MIMKALGRLEEESAVWASRHDPVNDRTDFQGTTMPEAITGTIESKKKAKLAMIQEVKAEAASYLTLTRVVMGN